MPLPWWCKRKQLRACIINFRGGGGVGVGWGWGGGGVGEGRCVHLLSNLVVPYMATFNYSYSFSCIRTSIATILSSCIRRKHTSLRIRGLLYSKFSIGEIYRRFYVQKFRFSATRKPSMNLLFLFTWVGCLWPANNEVRLLITTHKKIVPDKTHIMESWKSFNLRQ